MIIQASIIALVALLIKDTSQTIPPGWGNKFESPSKLGNFTHGAVSANGHECATIAKNILVKGGSAVDAAIAAMLCDGVASFHNMGLGGGCYMMIWDAKKKEAVFLNAREKAPGRAHTDMFNGNAALSYSGGLSVAVPGELLGMWEAHKRYGKLPWSELFTETIQLCIDGCLVTQYLEDQIAKYETNIKAEPTMAEILIDPDTKSTWKRGTRIKRPKLAKFLKTLSEMQNPNSFYGGDIGRQLVEEIKGFGGILELDDLAKYNVEWKEPIAVNFSDITDHLTMFAAPPPASGVILAFIMNVIQGLLPAPSEPIFWQRIIETFKWAYAHRTEFGDPNFVEIGGLIDKLKSKEYADEVRQKIKDDWTSNDALFYGAQVQPIEDHGTGNIAVLADDGSAVAVTSTINQPLGAMIRSESTGIIFNDQMDDFSAPNVINGFDLPPSVANFIKPGKRPLSSMSPTIIVDGNKNIRLVIGGAGGTKITTAVALTTILHLWYGYNVKEAVDIKRLHHQLLPMEFVYEPNFNESIKSFLVSNGHVPSEVQRLGSAVTVIAKNNGEITANSEYRREGSMDGY